MRKDLYEKVKALNLQEAIKETYGKNYTQCTNLQLELSLLSKEAKKVSKEKTEALEGTPASDKSYTASTAGMKIEGDAPEKGSRFEKLVDFLFRKRILLRSERDAIIER